VGNNLVIFWDFDGTLGYREGGWGGALLQALDEKGIEHNLKREDFRPFLSSGFPWHNPEQNHSHLSTPEKWWSGIKKIFREAYNDLGIRAEEAEDLADLAHRFFINPENFRLYDDTIEALRKMQQNDWNNIILSNHVPELDVIVQGLGLDKYITECISSANVGYEKPHPEIFRIGLAKAKNPQKAWMVGDNINADIRGANRVGIPAILVRKEKRDDVKYQADNLKEAARIIEENSRKE